MLSKMSSSNKKLQDVKRNRKLQPKHKEKSRQQKLPVIASRCWRFYKNFRVAITNMFKEQKETMLKEEREGIVILS